MTGGGNSNASTTFSGVISGDGAFSKAGSGITTLSGANTYTGGTSVSAGTLKLSGSLADTALSVSSGATYDVDATDEIGSISGAGVIDVASGVTLTAGRLNNATTTFSGVISGDGAFSKAGSGTTSLLGVNTYTGATTINGGTVAVMGSLADTTVVDVASGATYHVAASDTIGGLKGAGDVDLGGKTLTVNIAASDGSTEFTGAINGSTSSSSLTKSGSGKLKLSGTNTYEGATTVEAGVLEVSNASALGTSTRGSTANGTTIQQGGALNVAGGASVNDFTLAEQLTLGSYSSPGEAIIQLIFGSATITNPFELQGNSAIEALGGGELLLSDTTLSSGNFMIALGSSCGVSFTCNLRIGGNSSGSSGSVKTYLDSSSPSASDGINLGSEKLTVNNNGVFIISGASTVNGSVLVDSGDLQLAHVDAMQPSDITMQNEATYSFLTDFPEISPSGSPKIITLGAGNQTVYVAVSYTHLTLPTKRIV